ncbi:MAG: oligosaccharide flippase family protein [Chitinophagales bacterium]|nr:oligosaccharide flippase family protein [Chitinophagales bacterium]
MGVIRRQSILSSIVTYLGIFVGYFTVAYLFPKFFTKEEFGLTRVIISIAAVCAVFSRAGFSSAIMKYFPYYRDPDKKHNGFLLFVLSMPLFSYAAVCLLYWLLKPIIVDSYIERSPLFVDYYYYVLPVAFFVTYTLLLEYYLRALLDVAFALFVKEMLQRFFVMIGMLLFVFKFLNFASFVVAFVCAYALSTLAMLIYIYYKGELHLSFKKETFRLSNIKEFLNYGMYMMLSSSANILATNIDTIMLGALSGLDKTAIYTVSMYFGRIISIPRNTLSSMSASKAARLWKEEKWDEVKEIYKRTSTLQIIFGLLIFSLIWTNVDNIYRFIPNGGQFREGKYVLLFIGLANLFRIATSINTALISYSPSFKFNFRIMLAMVVLTVITNYIFIPMYGITGAALATSITLFLHNFAKFLFLWVKYKMQPFETRVLIVIFVSAVAIGICYYIPYLDNKYIDLAVRSAVCGSIIFLPIYFFRVSEDLNSLVNMMLSKIGIKISY